MNKTFSVLILMFVMAITTVARQPQQQTGNQNKTSETPADALTAAKLAIEKGNAQWITAWEKGDALMITDIFAEDGKILSGSGKIFTGHQQNGKPTVDAGKYVAVWKRQKDGLWKLFMDMSVPQD